MNKGSSRFIMLGTQYPYIVAAFPDKSEPLGPDDLRWNVFTDYFPGRKTASLWKHDMSETCMYHFTGSQKPWNTKGGGIPFDEWRRVAKTVL